jgi:hypothetical protein
MNDRPFNREAKLCLKQGNPDTRDRQVQGQHVSTGFFIFRRRFFIYRNQIFQRLRWSKVYRNRLQAGTEFIEALY